MKNICKDLTDQYDEIDAIVSDLDEEEWNMVTPFFDWTIKDEISHIAFFDATGKLAATSREEFQADTEDFFKTLKPGDNYFNAINAVGKKKSTAELLEWWRDQREKLIRALAVLNPKDRLPWYGPDMSARSFATARLMETWAHGQDIFDTLKTRRIPSDRLKHIAHIGVTTYSWSFTNRKLDIPTEAVRVELNSPSGEIWTWGPEGIEETVKGNAEDFCLVVTQRRNVADTQLIIQGEASKKWMEIAQAFAGPPENPPKPGQRVIKY